MSKPSLLLSLSEEKAPCSHRTNTPQKEKQPKTNNLNYTWKLCGRKNQNHKQSQACLLPHQQDYRDLLGEWGRCPSSCPDLWTLKKTEFTQEGTMKDISLEYSSDHGPAVLWHQQWSEWECHVLKVSGMSPSLCCAQEWWDPFVERILLKAGSVSKLLCVWLRFISRAGSWALRMPWADTPCAAAQHSQALHSPQVSGCSRPPLSSSCWLEASGRAWRRVKWASSPEKASPRWGGKSLSCSDTNAWKMNCLWI